ncbi:hypothetical protein [Clostridium beijerinckii]|uniref:hypothetical protein n=1 Tax=Clostridium beijerinckii TaxID=1520 RepID=UPI001112212F|nr:hypothetical protein [Clostridium beijerinckii]
MKRNIWDKLQFIFHRIISGIIFWIVSGFLISFQQLVVKNIRNNLLEMILYMVVFISFLSFYNISMKKNDWKPFGNFSDIIGVLIISFIFLILCYFLGNLKVIF